MEYLNSICHVVFLKVLPMKSRFCPTLPSVSWLANGRSLVFWSMVHPSYMNEMRKNLLMSPVFCWDHQKLIGLTKISFFWIFRIFFSFKSSYCILFINILRSPKTPRSIRVKIFRLCNEEHNGAISKILKKLQQVTLQIYLIGTNFSQ